MDVTAGVETLTITGADRGAHLRVCDSAGRAVATLVADEAGSAHLAIVPHEHRVLEHPDDFIEAFSRGWPLPPGEYSVTDESVTPARVHGPFRVLGVDDHPDPSLYDQDLAEGFGYVTVRDGVSLSIMVRFPNQHLYGPAPWPTVVEYSGYSPSDPDNAQPGTLIANLLGFAVVGVNMRGSGCSGGVFDIFSPAQAADGYDVVETVARQPWVLHGKVGMVGLSYAGISQLYVAATCPPHLAAITPLSVIDDLYRQQWPGGIYNSGFTRAWTAMRDAETKAGGMAWDQARIDAGDEVAAANQRIRTRNIDFERGGRAIRFFGPLSESRRIGLRVDQIAVPVYMTGAWQDEQTGSHFASMVGSMGSSPDFRFIGFNGHHPDGYSPMVLNRWFEFLSFHVARRVPRLPEAIRMVAPGYFAEVFGYTAELEPDRFAHHGDDFDAAFAEFLAEPPVRLLFENGAGSDVVGATSARYEASTTSFPPPGVTPRRWWFEADGDLVDTLPEVEGVDSYLDDLEAGEMAYSRELLNDLNRFTLPTTEIARDWTRFSDDHRVAFETEPLGEAIVVAGSGHVDLYLRAGSTDTAVQATITEVRPDGFEQRVQCGWHRPIHRVEDVDQSDDLRVDYTFAEKDSAPLEIGEWLSFRLPIYPFAHVFRPGSRIRLAISSPGRDHPFWCFDNPVTHGAAHEVGRGGHHPSSLVLPVWPTDLGYDRDYPHPDALRGQPARPVKDIHNPARARSSGQLTEVYDVIKCRQREASSSV